MDIDFMVQLRTQLQSDHADLYSAMLEVPEDETVQQQVEEQGQPLPPGWSYEVFCQFCIDEENQ